MNYIGGESREQRIFFPEALDEYIGEDNAVRFIDAYMYGYLNRVRTSRMLERECGRNVELMWLMRKLGPDFKTIADFRKENRQSFKRVFRQFVLLCKGIGLLGGELVAVDGSKFK